MSAGSVTPARRAAYELTRRVFEQDAWADRAFAAAAERNALASGSGERAQAQRLAYGAVQRRGTADAFIRRLSGKRLERIDPPVLAALRLGLFELLFQDSAADHAIVGEAVQLVRDAMADRGARRASAASGFANAILRRAARERAELLGSLDDTDPAGAAIAHSVPEWLAELWFSELGAEGARSLLSSVNQPTETALRVNPARGEPERTVEGLAQRGEPLTRGSEPRLLWPPGAFVREGRLGPACLAALKAGEMGAQSRGSQAVIEVLDPQPGERILDLCAGPGVKSAAIATRLGSQGELVCVERDPGRARQISEICAHLGAPEPRVVVADAGGCDHGGEYDRVLVDPPCSDLGTLASRPDARWRKSPATIAELAPIQAGILGRGIAALRVGGALVYSTCTISGRENELQVRSLLERESHGLDADDLGALEPSLASDGDPRFIQTRPDRDATDGFFIARLRKASPA